MEDGRSEMNTRDDALVIQIPNPVHSFHGDHWYHMGEYYLSRMNVVQSWIENWAELDKDTTNKKYTIYLVTSNILLHRMVTKFTFFFLVLMAWNPIVSKIHLVFPSKGLSTLSKTEYGKITSIAGKISYSFDFSPGKDSRGEPISLSDQTEHIYRGVLLGVLDNTPLPTSQWFAKGAVTRNRLQKHVQYLCPMTQRNSNSHVTDSMHSNSKKRLVIYQRDRIRRIVNIPDIFFPEQLRRIVYSSGTSTGHEQKKVQYLKNNRVEEKEYKVIEAMDVDGWEVEIINHDNNRDFCEVYHLLNPFGNFNHSLSSYNSNPEQESKESHLLQPGTPLQETVFITSHGFQLAGKKNKIKINHASNDHYLFLFYCFVPYSALPVAS